MRKLLLFALSLSLPVLAENFNSYPDTAAMRKVWLEYDAGNPAPETAVLKRTENGKAMSVTANRDYSLLYCEMENTLGAKASGLKLTLKGNASNPADAVLTLAVRAEKGSANLASLAVPLRSNEMKTVFLPVPELGKYKKAAVLLMFNKTGGTLNAVIDDLEFASSKRIPVDGFDAAADSAALKKAWPGFDAGNPAPEQMERITVNGKGALKCVTGNRTYSVICHEVKNPAPGKAEALTLKLAGVPGNDRSCAIVFGIRRDAGQPNFAQMQVTPGLKTGEFILSSPELKKLDRFMVVLSFHKTGGKFDAVIEEVAVQSLP